MKLERCCQCGNVLGIVRTYWGYRIHCSECGWQERLETLATSDEKTDYMLIVHQARVAEQVLMLNRQHSGLI